MDSLGVRFRRDQGARNVGVTLGETADARNVGVSAGDNRLARKDGCSPDEYIECNIIGLLLYTWLKCYSLEMLSDRMNVILYY